MFDEKTLKSFRATGNGLLTPDGELIAVNMYDHFSELRKRPEFSNQIEEFFDFIDSEKDDFIDSIPEGEHPEWHVFESWEDSEKSDFHTKLIEQAYDMGWGRIGTIHKPGRLYKFEMIELETSESAVDNLKKYAKELAEMFNVELKVTTR